MEELQEHLERLRSRFGDSSRRFKEEIFSEALAMLREDIENPTLTGASVHPDTYMLRANQVGLALLEAGFPAAAGELYRQLAKEVLEYRQRTGHWRHAGALFANWAAAFALQGDLDGAVLSLLRAASDDVVTYRMIPQRSFAITDLLEQYFLRPAREESLRLAQNVNPSVTLDDIESIRNALGEPEYAALAYVLIAVKHEKARAQFPNVFSDLQVLGALRSLSALLEVQLKNIAGDLSLTMFPAMEALYKAQPWWEAFNQTRKKVGATRKSTVPVDDQLRDAIALTPSNGDERFWKSLLVAYIVRNYTTHQLERGSALVRLYPEEALGHILHVMGTATKHVPGRG